MPIYTFNPSFTHPILWWGYTIYIWIGLHYEFYKIKKGGGWREGRGKQGYYQVMREKCELSFKKQNVLPVFSIAYKE